MTAMRAALVPMHELFSDEQPQMIVLTSLARGGDQIGAATACEAAKAQQAVEVALEVVMPFAEDAYPGLPGATRKEFTDEEANEFRRLEEKARQTICLAGTYDGNEDNEKRAYVDARDMLLQNSDILIAIYDPGPKGSVAGTRDTVNRALDSGSPVISVLVTESDARIAIDRQASVALDDDQWRTGVAQQVREQIVLPEFGDPDALPHALRRLALISGGTAPFYCTDDTLGQVFADSWKGLQNVVELAAGRELVEQLKGTSNPVADDIVLPPYAAFYKRADELTTMYMRAYRGAFVLSYLLAGLAVGAAVAILAMTKLGETEAPHALIASLGFMKIAILVVLLLMQRTGRRGKLQEAAADFRYLAELLRPMQWLTPVGTYPPAVDLPLHATPHDPRRSWTAWLARAVTRMSPSVSITTPHGGSIHPRRVTLTPQLSAGALDDARKQWIEGQVRYHSRNALRMHVLEEGLEHLAQALLAIVLLAAIGASVLEMQKVEDLPVILTALAAVLPAFIAAIGGVSFQSEAKRLASRSHAMQHALAHQQDLLASEAAKLRAAGPTHRADSPHATAILKHLSAITIAEAGDWKILYQVHEIHAA